MGINGTGRHVVCLGKAAEKKTIRILDTYGANVIVGKRNGDG
jgi:hypothetical protein